MESAPKRRSLSPGEIRSSDEDHPATADSDQEVKQRKQKSKKKKQVRGSREDWAKRKAQAPSHFATIAEFNFDQAESEWRKKIPRAEVHFRSNAQQIGQNGTVNTQVHKVSVPFFLSLCDAFLPLVFRRNACGNLHLILKWNQKSTGHQQRCENVFTSNKSVMSVELRTRVYV